MLGGLRFVDTSIAALHLHLLTMEPKRRLVSSASCGRVAACVARGFKMPTLGRRWRLTDGIRDVVTANEDGVAAFDEIDTVTITGNRRRFRTARLRVIRRRRSVESAAGGAQDQYRWHDCEGGDQQLRGAAVPAPHRAGAQNHRGGEFYFGTSGEFSPGTDIHRLAVRIAASSLHWTDSDGS